MRSCFVSLSLTRTRTHARTCIVSPAQKPSLTDIPIISLPIALHLAAPAPASSLLFFLPGGKVSGEARAERRALICINLRPISGDRPRAEKKGERANVCLLNPQPPLPTFTITTTGAIQKQEPSNQSKSPQRLVQSAQDLTQELITSPSPTIEGTKPCTEASKERHVERHTQAQKSSSSLTLNPTHFLTLHTTSQHLHHCGYKNPIHHNAVLFSASPVWFSVSLDKTVVSKVGLG